MPFGDGTGPRGFGPMTGRAAGYCAGYGVPGYMNPVGGQGYWGRGFGGGGRGHRNWFYATGLTGWQRAAMGYPMVGAYPYSVPVASPLSSEQEMELLKAQASNLENTLADIQKRIEELGQQQQESPAKKTKE